ncbi:hypothetical protein YA0850_01250 [Pseudomonas veronii]|uniref:HNH endonuclease n=1 Tax=Pseudomonas veronii TaxID=76761 RepID=A0ABS0VCC3_PSEVE|nr:hypothetical protein [Pseudomonas veronii]MBI6551051.1 hypothetical protein [Pseudomonas veronii]MBI6649149.1 hypothetical protein [Pseudomonas veronii]
MTKMPKNRSEAIAAGTKTYMTGKPCILGEISERSTKTKLCLCDKHKEATSANKREYYKEVREHRIAYALSYQTQNKEKARSYRDKYIEKDPVAAKAIARAHYERNRELTIQRSHDWFKNNKEKAKARAKIWASNNREALTAYGRNRKKRIRARTPSWFSELDLFILDEAYTLAVARKQLTGFNWHVDHMIPLYSRTASGLHLGCNIQVIPDYMNLMKQNKMMLTDHFEWMLYVQD